MTITIDVTPGEVAWLTEQATQQGLHPAEVIKRLIDAQLHASKPQEANITEVDEIDPTLALFEQWDKEDAHRGPEEVASDDQLWREFEQGINFTRQAQGMRQL